MLILLIVFSLFSPSKGVNPETCFYSQRVTLFNSYSIASVYNPSGYYFNVPWDQPQIGISNSSIFYTTATGLNRIHLRYVANVVSTTSATGTVMLNPLNGSEIYRITMTIVHIKNCDGRARLINFKLQSFELSPIAKTFNISTGIIFKGSQSNYQSQVFITDFDGYATNGTLNFAITIYFYHAVLNQDLHIGAYQTLVGQTSLHYTFLNHLTCTYILIDIYSFLINPITQNFGIYYVSPMREILVRNDFYPNAEKKCMLGIKSYVLQPNYKEDIRLTTFYTSNNSFVLKLRLYGGNILPTLFCLGYCREGTGRTPSNTCVKCPYLSITCSNMSYALTCVPGYYPQPTTIGIKKCFYCMPACKICQNYSYCIECQPTNVLTANNTCRKCQNRSQLAGGICSKIPGCSLAESINGKSLCRFCSIAERFLMIPVNQKCSCSAKYVLKGDKCVDRCGDGIILELQCDDNNTASHDGCSSECLQQKGYKCWKQNQTSPSQCIFLDHISIQLISTKRVNLQNKLILKFITQPYYLYSLSSSYIKSHLQTNLSIEIVDFIIEGKQITAQISFQEDIEGKSAFFILDINDPTILQKKLSYQIIFQSQQSLKKLQRIQIAKTIKYIISSIIFLTFLLFLVSLFFHKMIGIQTLLPFQIIYLTFLLNSHNTQIFSLFAYYSGASMNFLFYLNGFSPIQSSTTNFNFDSSNQNLVLIAAYCASIMMIVANLPKLLVKIYSGQKGQTYQYLNNYLKFAHNRLLVPISSLIFTPIIVIKSTIILKDTYLNSSHRFLIIFQSITLTIVIFSQWRGVFFIKSSMLQSNKKNSFYIPLYLSMLFIMSFLLSVSFIGTFTFIQPWLLGLCFFGTVAIIIKRPYLGLLDNLGVIIGNFQLIYFMIWSILRKIDPSYLTEQSQIFGILISLVFAIATIILGIIRLAFQIIQKRKQNKQNFQQNEHHHKQKFNYIENNIKQAISLNTRYQTKTQKPLYLQDQNRNWTGFPQLETFNNGEKLKQSQLKKYLMEKVKVIMKDREIPKVNEN